MFGRRRRRRRRGGAAATAAAGHRWLWLALAAATVVAAVLRLLDIGQWSFWVDEAHTYRDATMPLTGEHGFW
ncbi:MAG: hypothetical protein KDE27_11640, partial [Planctomycetes bacterium]|nr:hypothetical protein [Planctomycetota bacterium]